MYTQCIKLLPLQVLKRINECNITSKYMQHNYFHELNPRKAIYNYATINCIYYFSFD